MNLKEIKDLQAHYAEIIDNKLEEYGKSYIGKTYRRFHPKDENVFGSHDFYSYIYVYKPGRWNLACIEFRDINIQRIALPYEYLENKEGYYEEISFDEFREGLKYYIDLFKFDKIFGL